MRSPNVTNDDASEDDGGRSSDEDDEDDDDEPSVVEGGSGELGGLNGIFNSDCNRPRSVGRAEPDSERFVTPTLVVVVLLLVAELSVLLVTASVDAASAVSRKAYDVPSGMTGISVQASERQAGHEYSPRLNRSMTRSVCDACCTSVLKYFW